MKGAAITLTLCLAACASTAHQPSLDLTRFQSPLPEFGLTRGPDGWYLSRMDGPFGTDANSRMLRFPFESRAPVEATFGTGSSDGRDFSWNAKMQRGCFVRNSDIWCMSWDGAAWRDAAPLPNPINTPGYEASPHIASDGTLYFASMREGGSGQGDIYRANRSGDSWQVTRVGAAINSATGEWNLTLSPDGKMMVFEASGRTTNRTGSGDLYLSCLRNGRWTNAQPMSELNTDGSDLDFRFTSPHRGVFTTATIGGDGVLRAAAPEHFTACD